MAAAWMRVRSGVRARWVSWLAVAVVAGIGSGVVIGLMAGARRTESAYRRFVHAQHAIDVLIAGKSSFGLIGSVDLDQVEKLPEVASTARANASLFFAGRLDDGRPIGPADVFPVAPVDTRLGNAIEGWKMLHGRRAQPGARRRGHRELRPRRPAASPRRIEDPAPLPARVELPAGGRAAPVAVRRAPRGRAGRRGVEHRRARRWPRRDGEDRRDRGVAGGVPTARHRPVARVAPHPGVEPALHRQGGGEPVVVRALEARRPAPRVRARDRAARTRPARRLHRERAQPERQGPAHPGPGGDGACV